jgi:predicted metal-dependent phosphoesterase TrpH
MLNLNALTKEERLENLRKLMVNHEKVETGENVNNHIHTTYSFSPYSPTKAVYMAWRAGLATAGIADHDSVGGLREFIEAGKIVGIPTTVGFEMRYDFRKTPFNGKRINNTDQNSIAYLVMHGVPHDKIDVAEAFLQPFRLKRNERNRRMITKLNTYIAKAALEVDFDRDVLPISMWHDGGSVTERHILFALVGKILEKVARGADVVAFLRDKFDIEVSGTNLTKLTEPSSDYYEYYLLAVLRGYFMGAFYIDADEELPNYRDFIKLGDDLGAITAYPYLGDVGVSVTGDKMTEKYEDDYLDELVAFLKDAGFKAITYMPTRNTDAQLRRLMALCDKHNLFQICGEDINSPFQSFVCKALERDEYKHLIDAAWALIKHENSERMI